jgi:hypothetical protein
MKHLTDEQLAGWLAGEENQQARSHLDSCPQCNAEALELRDGISRYAVAMRRQSSVAENAHMNGRLSPRRALALHRLRWAGAGVLALLLVAQTAWLVKPRHAPASAQPTASALVSPQREAQPATQLSDDELLEAVNNDLSREVPLALAPVSAITVARNKIAAASSRAANAGDLSGK